MSRDLVYLAHPVGGDVTGNLERARQWLLWLMVSEPDVAFEASWIACISAGADDNDPTQRERGMADNLEIVTRCDGIVLCGGRISSGMQRELDRTTRDGGWVADLTSLGVLPPTPEAWSAMLRERVSQYVDDDVPDYIGGPLDFGRLRWEAP